MCGIAGLAGFRDDVLLRRMTDLMIHRGPDDEGFHHGSGCSLGHRRLAIIDPEGTRQPLANEDHSVWTVFNGEIYNFVELRRRLEGLGHTLAERGDTEVVVHAYEQWGDDFPRRLNGMFGLAVWDERRRRLLLARDRFGEKPLYYAVRGDRLAFASEVKPLLAWSAVRAELDPAALDAYLTLRYACHPDTFFRGVRKLPPGWILVREADGRVWSRPYWTLSFEPAGGRAPSVPDADIAAEYAGLLEDAVRLRMVSDVPLGAFLSGGIDSNAFVYFMTRHATRPVRTFTLGFGSAHDEDERARAFAELFRTDHRSFRFEAKHLDLLPRVVWHLEEPVGDAMTVAWFHLLQFVKREVTVGLIGGGSDEVLGGYVHHVAMTLGDRALAGLPPGLRRGLLRRAVERLPVGLLGRLFDYPAELGAKGRQRLADYLAHQESASGAYRALVGLFSEDEKRALYSPVLRAALTEAGHDHRRRMADLMDAGDDAFLHRLIRFDTRYYLSDFGLLTGDKNTMAHSFELRLPFLDPRLVEFAARLPPRFKIRGRRDKWLLRAAMAEHLPPEIARRKKQGFYVPVDRLFPEGFARYARSVLTPEAVRRRGLFRYEAIEDLLRQLDRSGFVVGKQLMALVIFEVWCRVFLDGEYAFTPSVVPYHRPPALPPAA